MRWPGRDYASALCISSFLYAMTCILVNNIHDLAWTRARIGDVYCRFFTRHAPARIPNHRRLPAGALAQLGLRFCDFFCKKVVLDVLNLNNFIITKSIKTKQNVKHIIRKPE